MSRIANFACLSVPVSLRMSACLSRKLENHKGLGLKTTICVNVLRDTTGLPFLVQKVKD